MARRIPRRVCLLLCLAHFSEISAFADTSNADYEYRTDGIGNKYSGAGWEGFSGFGEEAGTARDRAGSRANDAEKQGQNYQDRANELNGMGNQVGEDRNKLIPQVQQAKQQDQKNSSGSSQLQKLYATQYPEKADTRYGQALKMLGITNNRELMDKGVRAQKKFYEEASNYEREAKNSLDQAAQGLNAAKQLGAFQQTAIARNSAMGSIKQSGSTNNLAARLGKNGHELSGAFEDGKIGSLRNGSSKLNSFSSISSGDPKFLEANGSPNHLSREGFLGNAGNRSPASTKGTGKEGNASDSHLKSISKEQAIAQLDAMPDIKLPSIPAYIPSGAIPDVGSPGNGTASKPLSAEVPVHKDTMETLKEVLQISEADPAPLVPATTTVQRAPNTEASSIPGSGFFLEEESLFRRVRKVLVQAAQSGRIVRP